VGTVSKSSEESAVASPRFDVVRVYGTVFPGALVIPPSDLVRARSDIGQVVRE
jgi:hypothetical protein